MRTLIERQQRHLRDVIDWASRIQRELQPIIDAHGDRVHFRPSSTGVAMVGLLPSRPQRGRSGIRDLKKVTTSFEEMFARDCRDVPQGRPTPEKQLQSYLIRTALTQRRRLVPLNVGSQLTPSPAELLFITDELVLPSSLDDNASAGDSDNNERLVCDLLALRIDAGRVCPVVIELKSSRSMSRLIEQVTRFAATVDTLQVLFAELVSTVLGEEKIMFGAPCEKWVVWPAAGNAQDPREAELLQHGIRVVGYADVGITQGKPAGEDFAFRVGNSAVP